MKNIIKVCAFLLCVFFFTLPLVSVNHSSWFTNINAAATGWDFAMGKDNFYSNPLVLIFVIIPATLFVLALQDKSFAVLRNVSIAGLVSKIIFLLVADIMLKSGSFIGELTEFNWLILLAYIGLVGLTQHCVKQECS
ncbi:MAG: hypothetical protein LBC85_11990 [Fibromonadaceae bacterium]|jgi:hypothetical protein|nr:hypothetical protein [Fibromonadaceae bacterium]